jgi:hypothetical protein
MRQPKMSQNEAEEIATSAFGMLAEEPERTIRFLNLSGLDPADLRHLAGTPEFQLAVLAHVRGDESLLMVLAAQLNVPPERIEAAERFLTGAVEEF